MKKRVVFQAFICLLSSSYTAYGYDPSGAFKKQANVEIENIAPEELEPTTFIHFACDDDLRRVRFSLDEENPYVLLRAQDVQLFTHFAAVVGEHSIGSVAFVTSLLSSGSRCIKYDLLENAREAMIMCLQEFEHKKGARQLKEKLMSLENEYVHAALMIVIPEVGSTAKSLLICGGQNNEHVVDKRFPEFNVIATQLRPPQKVVIKGKLFARVIKTRAITPLPDSLRFVQNASTSIVTTGACPPNNLQTNAAEVSSIHFVSDLLLGDLNPSGVAKGMKIVFDSLPATGVYIKISLQGDTNLAPNSRLIVREYFIQSDGTITTLTADSAGSGSFSVFETLNLPDDIVIDFLGEINNAILTYKVIAQNIICIISSNRTV